MPEPPAQSPVNYRSLSIRTLKILLSYFSQTDQIPKQNRCNIKFSSSLKCWNTSIFVCTGTNWKVTKTQSKRTKKCIKYLSDKYYTYLTNNLIQAFIPLISGQLCLVTAQYATNHTLLGWKAEAGLSHYIIKT